MHLIKSILNFVKIEHTLFSLPLIYGGVFLASKDIPPPSLILLILIGATSARTVALTLNRLIDREIDKQNPRTANRELPSGRLSVRQAVGILVIGLVVYFLSTYLISDFCFYLSPIPLIIFTGYPYLKRLTPLAHFGVGLGLSMAPLGGWFAVTQSFTPIIPGALLSLVTLFWVTGFDIIYSTLDEEFDRQASLYSFVVRFGKVRALQISGYLHLAAYAVLALLFFLYIKAVLGLPFLFLSGYLLYLEHKKADDVELAFFKINAAFGFAIFLMIIVRGNLL
ncbi:MAG: UbiA-like polyprenyltransferase [Bacteroidota bacterium]